MAKITITINGTEILNGATKSEETTREAWLDVATVKNIDSKTTRDALTFLGGKSYADAVAKIAKPDSVVVITSDGKTRAEYKLGNLARRMLDALGYDARSGIIHTDAGKKSADDGEPVVAILPTL